MADEELEVTFTLENDPLNAEYELTPNEEIDADFLINAQGTTWGSISGTLANQTDLQAALDLKADKTEVESVTGALSDSITAVSDNLQSEATTRADNDVILQNNINNLSDSLTTEIGNRTSADTILQGNINAIDNKYISITGGLSDRIDTLSDTVTANYNTLDDKIDSVNGALTDSINAVDDKYNSITGGLSDDIDALESVVSANFATLSDSISDETTARINADSIIGDSITALDNKYNSITGGLSDSITAIDNTINNYGDIVTYDAADFATSLQGALADTALQPNDNISELNNDAGYITSSSLPTVNNATITIQKNGTTVESFTLNQSTNETVNISVPTTAAEVNALPDTTTINDLTTSTQQAALNSGANTTNIGQIATNTNAISNEVTDRQNADIALQNQIDAIVSSSDVFDIVGTYAELQAYDISTVPPNDIIKVLVDSTHNNAATYYRCVENGGVKSWSYIGSEGAYYTKGEADATFVPQTRTINGKALSNNITLSASDVGALPDSTVIPTVNNSTITIQKNGAAVDTFTLNQATAKTINIIVPTDTNDLTNGAGFISGISYADVIAALGFTPYNSTNPNGYITSADLSGYATESWVNNQGFITGITSSDIITALSYTPYDASNPDGFITSADLANYLQKDVAQSTTGTITFVGQKKIEFKQSAAADKLGFTCFNDSGTEIGAFEYRPNTIGSGALFNINVPYSSTSYVGFRYWGTAVNIVAPKVATAGTYYIPVNITDGNTTVTAANTGTVNISSLLPDISTKQDTLVSGTNIKTVNNTSLLGSGNIDTTEIFVAEYGTTTYAEIDNALNNYKFLKVSFGGVADYLCSGHPFNADTQLYEYHFTKSFSKAIRTLILNENDVWSYQTFEPVDKSGDTMTGGLRINDDKYSINGTFPTSTPSSNTYLVGYELYGNNTRLGLMGLGYYASGNTAIYLQHERTVSGTIKYSSLQVGIDDSGNGYCTFPNSNCVDAQWVQKYSKLADTSGTKAGTSYSLSSYLPNDGQKYEVKFRLFAYTSSSTCSYYCNTDIFNNGQTSTAVESDYCFVYSGGYSRQNTVVFDLPVGTGRYVKLYGSGSASVILCALGYRRIGTNS